MDETAIASPSPSTGKAARWEAPARTELRSLPWLNRVFNDLPSFLAQSSAPAQSWWKLPTSIVAGLAPADAAAGVSGMIVEKGQRARPDQSLLERVQQERMTQESNAALAQSQQLATGESSLLSAPHRPEPSAHGQDHGTKQKQPLSIEQAALASAIHHYRYGAHAIGNTAKVTFKALVDHVPKRAVTAFRSHIKQRPKRPAPELAAVPGASAASKRAAASDREAFRALRHRSPKTIVQAAWRFVTECVREGLFTLHLTLLLIAQMGLFGRWLWMTVRLLIFAVFLVQAWIKIGLTVLLCHRIERSVQYGPFNRNFLDIYLPTNIRGSILKPIENNQYQPDYTESDAPSGGGAVRTKHPVFVYVTGGAWVIGYKGWGALLGLVLRAQGCVVVSVDYRNFPQGNIEDMVVDVEQALRWIYGHIEDFGGDREQIYLSGQSAGGQITSIVLLRNAKREAQGAFDDELREEREGSVDDETRLAHTEAFIAQASTIADHAAEENGVAGNGSPPQQHADEEAKDGSSHHTDLPLSAPVDDHPAPEAAVPQLQLGVSSSSLLALSTALRTGFPASRIKGYIGISGVYSMAEQMLNHLHASGLPGGVTLAIMGGRQHLDAVNPTRMIRQQEFADPAVVAKFPPTLLIAGTADRSVPLIVPRKYATALSDAGVPVSFRSYIDGTHTSPIIEAPLRGCHHLTHDIITFFQQCRSGEAELGRSRQSNRGATGESEEAKGARRSASIPIRILAPLPFEVNGEVMVNALSVRCAGVFNPF